MVGTAATLTVAVAFPGQNRLGTCVWVSLLSTLLKSSSFRGCLHSFSLNSGLASRRACHRFQPRADVTRSRHLPG